MAEVDGKPVCAVIPSDCEVSMKKLAAVFHGKAARMMTPAAAERLTGYRVGGISPFGQRRKVPTAIEASGARGGAGVHQCRPARVAGAAGPEGGAAGARGRGRADRRRCRPLTPGIARRKADGPASEETLHGRIGAAKRARHRPGAGVVHRAVHRRGAALRHLDHIAGWAASLGFLGLQVPTGNAAIFDLQRAAESDAYCDEVRGTLASHGLELTELNSSRLGCLLAVHPAYDETLDILAPPPLRGRPEARREWAREQLLLAAPGD